MRVVSLLPAATEIVAALEAGDALVGVSHECDWPPEVRSLPRVTRTTLDTALPSGAIDRAMAAARTQGVPPVQLDLDLLRRLAPQVVIGQSVCEVCAVGAGELARAADALGPGTRVVTLHAHVLQEVFADITRVGEALDLREEAAELTDDMRDRLRWVAAQHVTPVARQARVVVLEWVDPPYVAGHWVPQLVKIAGGCDVGARLGERSRAVSWRDLTALAPDVVIVALCGFDEARARREVAALDDPDAAALLNRRVEFLDGNAYTSRPGPRLAEAAERLARLIHG
jgi:iron complex transport system substrate-binding protein